MNDSKTYAQDRVRQNSVLDVVVFRGDDSRKDVRQIFTIQNDQVVEAKFGVVKPHDRTHRVKYFCAAFQLVAFYIT